MTVKRTRKSSAVIPLQPASERLNVLVVAHNHPHFFPGGAEIIAYDLFKAMKARPELEPFFLAAVTAEDRKVHTGTPFQMIGGAQDEMLFWGGAFDYFLQSQQIQSFMTLDFAQFLKDRQPDVIHFHHTMRLGLEAISIARQVLPQARIIYTLHEFILMCHRDGQMVRKHNNELCSEATPARCHQCFPEISPAQFKIRESFIKAHLDAVDCFVSPSHFLAERFIAWGLPRAKMRVLENGRELVPPAPHRPIAKAERRNVFGYFGQINPYKGAMLTFQAVETLIKQGFTDFRLELFGNVEQQTEAFKKDFFDFLDRTRDQVGFHGKYSQSQLPQLMAQVDWVIVPSTWWENSPLVIQEAFMHRRPILCSDIGGMAEKVENGVTGLHFTARNAFSLAKTMRRAAEEPGLWARCEAAIGPRLSVDACLDGYLEFYMQSANRLTQGERHVV